MSRHEIVHSDKVLAFGYDHACGEFLQIWTVLEDPEEAKMQARFGPDPDEMLVDEDNMTGFARDMMLELIAEHGFQMYELERAEAHDCDTYSAKVVEP